MACEKCTRVIVKGPRFLKLQEQVDTLCEYTKVTSVREGLRLLKYLQEGDVVPQKMWEAICSSIDQIRDTLVMLPTEVPYKDHKDALNFAINLEHGPCSNI